MNFALDRFKIECNKLILLLYIFRYELKRLCELKQLIFNNILITPLGVRLLDHFLFDMC